MQNSLLQNIDEVPMRIAFGEFYHLKGLQMLLFPDTKIPYGPGFCAACAIKGYVKEQMCKITQDGMHYLCKNCHPEWFTPQLKYYQS